MGKTGLLLRWHPRSLLIHSRTSAASHVAPAKVLLAVLVSLLQTCALAWYKNQI